MTEKEEIWLEQYLESGQAKEAVKVAFPDCKTEGSITARASQLKTKLAIEIDSRLMAGYKKDCPQAVRIIKDLMLNAQQEAVKYKAARDWVSLAGHDAAFKVEHNQKQETHEELQARLKAAMSELTTEELAPFLKTLATDSASPEMAALVELSQDNPQ